MVRHLVLILGDQLDHHAAGLDGFDPRQDCIWMAEVKEESSHVRSSKQRIALFLSAMRHFAKELKSREWPVDYTKLDSPKNTQTLSCELKRAIERHKPSRLIMTAPGDWRVLQGIRVTAQSYGIPLEIREDRHFFSTVREFADHAKGRKQLRLEYWYRELREKTGILMENGKPAGGQWNFDQENRGAFGKDGPVSLPKPLRFKPDAITSEVIQLVNTIFDDHPGSVTASAEGFGWPVSRKEALKALNDFIQHRLALFGTYQDAMWTGEPWLYHAHIASALNLKMLCPEEVVRAAEKAYQKGLAPLAAVEGFIRQILGWREYVRGIYWLNMPDYLERNALSATAPLPDFFWTGDTEMTCLRETIQQTLRTGYAHHIQRLMITGLYTLLAGIHPKAVHEWYLSVYVDAVEWVELPNVLGMSQYADGGIMASKPYAASGKYIDRMSNYCKHCRFNPAQSSGKDSCPITTLYWDFLMRHEALLAKNPRMVMQIRNLGRLGPADRKAIKAQAAQLGISGGS
jgi:deoxyribodipyrimidine photolyase-related protein